MKTMIPLGAALGLALLAPTAGAHHSTNNIYDESKTVEITGVVKEWRLVNPHPYLIVEAEDENGELRLYDLSFGGSAAGPLMRRGYTRESFTIGETVTATGNPARAEDSFGVLVRGGFKRADGSDIP